MRSKFKLGQRLLMVSAATVICGGLGLALVVRPAAPVARHFPIITASPARDTAKSSPAVAAGETVAPSTLDSPTTPAPARASNVSPPSSAPAAASSTNHAGESAVSGPTATLALATPDGGFSYAVPATEVSNACDILTAAKAHGFLRSVTLDYSYQSTLHSAYVREIDGYANNWTFKVNGASPQGCSLALVTQGDTVSWSYH